MSVAIAIAREDDTASPRPDRNLEQPTREAGAAPHANAATNESASVLRPRVLIAEDNEALRETLNDILSAEGYIVMEAEDGREALGVLGDSPVDVLVLDLAMPRIDGIELLRQIDPPPPVVVVYSAFEYYTPEEVRRSVGSKVFRSLKKPVPPAQLLRAVADAIAELEQGDK